MANEIKTFRDYLMVGKIRKNPKQFEEVSVSPNGWKTTKLNYILSTEQGDSIFLTIKGGFSTTRSNDFKMETSEGVELNVAWADRLNPTIVNSMPDFRKIKINLTSHEYGDYENYLQMIDVVNKLKTGLVDDTRVFIQMRCSTSSYLKDGKRASFESKNLKSLRLASEDEEDKIVIDGDFLVNSSSMVTEPNGDIMVNGYTSSDKKEVDGTKTVLYEPIQFSIRREDISEKIFKNTGNTPSEEVIDKVIEMYKKIIMCPVGKIKRVSFIMKYVNKSSYMPAEEKDLTLEQRNLIELGMSTIELELKKMGSKKGDGEKYISLITPNYKLGENNSPSEEVELTEDDLFKNPFAPSIESLDETINNTTSNENIQSSTESNTISGSDALAALGL